MIVTPGIADSQGGALDACGASTLTAGEAGSAAGQGSRTALIRGADLVATPWKNGGGVTCEIAAVPPGAGLDAFIWRVSLADVAQAGPFSRFVGIDRTLVLLSGAGMLLDEKHGDVHGQGGVHQHTLTQPLDIARFTGEAAIDAALVDGATRDFNLMVRRGAATGTLEVWQIDGEAQEHSLTADVVLLFCAAGSPQVTLREGAAHTLTLSRDDTLHIDAPHALPCTVSGHGALLAISIRYA